MVKKKAHIKDYVAAIDRIASKNNGFYNYDNGLSNMKKWLCVHATNYMPLRNKNGEWYIPTTAMATDYKYARATVHVTLNQIVSSHMFGNWDCSPVVILAPYNSVVEKNGNPSMVATEDTFFVPNPDTGLILPENAHIVKPNNKTLFHIGDKISTYKTDYYTDEEIETILSFMKPYDRKEYEKYANVDFSEEEIEDIMKYETKTVQEQYKKSKDKRAFLRGYFEEDRMTMLTKFLREAVVRMTMQKMGYDYVKSHEDWISNEVADIARDEGIPSSGNGKGHSGSLEHEFEHIGSCFLDAIRICNTNDISQIYEYCTKDWFYSKYLAQIILKDKPFNLYQEYKEKLNRFIDSIRSDVEFCKRFSAKYPDDVYYAKRAKEAPNMLKYADELEQGGIKAYNPYLDTVLQRNADRLNQDFANAMEKLKQNPDYPLLKKMLTDLVKNGKRWRKTKGGWQPEPNDKDEEIYDSTIPKRYDLGRGM